MWPIYSLADKLLKMDKEIIQLPVRDGSSLVENYSSGIPCFPRTGYGTILRRSYFAEVSSYEMFFFFFFWVFNMFCYVILIIYIIFCSCALIPKYDLQRFHMFASFVIGIAVLLVFWWFWEL